MLRSLLFSLALAMTAGAATAAAPEEAAMAGLPHVAFPAPHRVASGRLQAGDIATLKRAGIRQVIDLSLDSETPDRADAEEGVKIVMELNARMRSAG